LQGITKENIHDVYTSLQGLSLFSFTFDTFLRGELTDVDFKRDFINEAGLKLVDRLILNAKRVRYGRACTPFRGKGKDGKNQGIQFSERKTARYKTQPYLKLYNKHLELTTKSDEFRELYLPDTDMLNLWRIETTVKNKKHFRLLGINDTTLKAIMELEQDKLENILQRALKSHLEPLVRVYSSDGIKPDDVPIRNLIEFCMDGDRGLSYESILKIALGDLEGSNRTKKRDKIDRIYEAYIKGSDQDKESIQMDEIYEVIGYKS
jgi:hypothetical protein